MACYHLVQSLRSILPYSGGHTTLFGKKFTGNKNGKVYSPLKYEVIMLPCGGCYGCRLERSRQWAVRCVHEAQLYGSNNCYITLTYDDDHLPANSTLVLRDFQLFMKRLRRKFPDNGIRFFHCGEYGEKRGRPHYHAIIFGFDFPDKVFWKNILGFPYYRSSVLESLWTTSERKKSSRTSLGFSSISDVSFGSAAYVARYIMKKVNGKKRDELVGTFNPDDETVYFKKHYDVVDFSTGEVFSKLPEYVTMSRRPGIGTFWFDQYHADVFPSDQVVVKRGDRYVEMLPPKFYDKLLERRDPELYTTIKSRRSARAALCLADNTPERLAVREQCKLDSIKRLVRSLD
jgi:hypothetical protein